MAEKSKISWTDSTLNFWEGCTKVSAGCANCYAETRDKHWHGGAHWGPGSPRRKSKSAVKDALRLNAKPWICKLCGVSVASPVKTHSYCSGGFSQFCRRRILSLSLGDWLEGPPVKVVDGVPCGGIPVEWRAEMLDMIWRCDAVEWILCSKMPGAWEERMGDVRRTKIAGELAHWIDEWKNGNAPANVTLLASVENQEQADKRIPALLHIPAARRGLSLEPLLGPVDLSKYLGEWCSNVCCEWKAPILNASPRCIHDRPMRRPRGVDWLIIGGESGPKARPCNVEWIRAIVRQGKAAGVPVFVKQLGNYPYVQCIDSNYFKGELDAEGFKHIKLNDRKGADTAEWPEDLRVQQFPFDS